MTVEVLQIVFRCGCMSAESALQKVYGVLERLGVPLRTILSVGDQASVLSETRRLQYTGRKSFHLSTSELDIQFASLAYYGLAFLKVSSGRQKEWQVWVEQFWANDGFVMAWVVDRDYDFWQNATDPLQYEAAGRDYSGLTLKPNGLPPPLDQIEIDTSRNPGRYVLHHGYVEAVGATMWLGACFWQRTGVTASDVQSAKWLDSTIEGPGVVSIRAAEMCFRRPDGEQRERQEALRALLFPPDVGESEQ